jgi:3-hydroxyacyl-CoA dehydrogenase
VVSKKTTASVWDYLYNSTGAEKFRRPAAVDAFIAEGRLGALTGSGWYEFGRDYPSIVTSRDEQLKLLLDWLTRNDRAADFRAS